MRSPLFITGSGDQCLLACHTWLIMIVSWVACKFSTAIWANSCTPLYSDVGIFNVICGKYPYMSSNGAKPVDLFMLEFIANSIIGICIIQSHWSGQTLVLNICMTFCIIHSVCPSVWGWNEVDNFNLTPRSR